ncbi:MAG: response regulator [Eubacteriales bacterium]|nr:response regulator [Eubacteriales bacterium]
MNYRILIVEDDANYRFAIREGVPWEEYGFTVVGEAIHGKQALEFLKKNPVDILLTDISMPQMNGVELTRRVRAEYPEIQIVVLSAYDDFAFVRESLKYGARDYILKQEMNPADVIQTVLKICETAEAEKEKVDGKERMEQELRLFLRGNRALSKEAADWLGGLWPRCMYCAAMVWGPGEGLQAVLKRARQEENILYAVSDHECRVLLFGKLECGSRRKLTEEQRGLAERILAWPEGMEKVFLSRESGADFQAKELLEEVVRLADLQDWFGRNRIFLYYDYESRLAERNCAYVYIPKEETGLPTREEMEAELARMREHLRRMLPDEKHLNESFLRFMVCYARRLKADDWKQLTFYEELVRRGPVDEKEAFLRRELEKLWRQKEAYAGKSPEIQKALRYLQEHFTEDLTLGDVAGAVELSENYFSNLFKAETGENLMHYINSLRIARAKELMASTNLKVYEIAEEVGYRNAAYFSTIFRKITKVSVSEYRKEQSVKSERNR